METTDGFVPIDAIFYSVFHPTEGTKIVHQVPENAISSLKDGTVPQTSLFNFDTVKNYIIPKPQLCNKFISFKVDKFRVLGYPVNIENSEYSRNSFNFNFCFVFPYNSDTTPYESAIERMGKMFRVLEEQNFLLSKLDKEQVFFKEKDNPTKKDNLFAMNINDNFVSNTPGLYKAKKTSLSSIESLISQIYQDLNNYSECCIPLDNANSVDIKLFPILPPPINIKAFQVPISKVNLFQLVDANWDPTMIKILPYINGVNSIKRISQLADADYILTKQCIQHLMHYKCIELLDIFQFGNIYAPTNYIGDFLKINGMAEKCQGYIITADYANKLSDLPLATDGESREGDSGNSRSASLGHSVSPFSKTPYLQQVGNNKNSIDKQTIKIPSKATLFYLYRSLNQGQTVKEWYIHHKKQLANIDVRRFISFGVLNGLIYRIYSYPVLNSITRSIESGSTKDLDSKVRSLVMNKAPIPQTEDETNPHLLENTVNESKLTTSNWKRRVSFNYNVDSRHSVAKNLFESEDDDDDDDDDEEEEEIEDDNENSATNLTSVVGDGNDDEKSENFDYEEAGVHSGSRIEDENEESTEDEVLSESNSRAFSDKHQITSQEKRKTAEDDAIGDSAKVDNKSKNLRNVKTYLDEKTNPTPEDEPIVRLVKLLKGFQHFDSISTELQRARVEVEELLNQLGSYGCINS